MATTRARSKPRQEFKDLFRIEATKEEIQVTLALRLFVVAHRPISTVSGLRSEGSMRIASRYVNLADKADVPWFHGSTRRAMS